VVGEHWGGDLGGELEEGGVAVRAWVDPEYPEPSGEAGRVQVLSGVASGEQSVGLVQVCCGALWAAER
jgi:hypothetical protein